MIAGLAGKLTYKDPTGIEIDVNGVRYACQVSLITLGSLGSVGSPVDLTIYTHVREDTLRLFGFQDRKEKAIFLAFIGVSGIGPKLALNILSGLPADELGQAVVNGDVARLVSLPGVGKRTAERILVELKDRLTKLLDLEPEAGSFGKTFAAESELVSALLNLGYKPKLVDKVIGRLAKSHDKETSVEVLIRAALGEMRS